MILRHLKRSRRLIGIHLDRDEIKALSMREESEGCTLLAALRKKRMGGDLGADLERAFNGQASFRGKGVLVTGDVKFLSSDLGSAGGEHLSEEKLLAAATWEMEPYLDFSSSDGLFGCRRQAKTHEGGSVPVLISAVFKKTYEDLAAAFKRTGIDLVAAYAPQAAAACASGLPAPGRNRILLDGGERILRGVLLSENGPVVFQDTPAAAGTEMSPGLVRDMLYGFGVQEGTETDIVLSGSHFSEDLLRELVPDFPLARTWRIADIPGIRLDSAKVECGPDYALAAGGVLGEMEISGQTVPCVTDRVPLGRAVARRLRENRRIIPSAVLGCFILCLGLHYGYTQFRIARYRTEIRKLEEERKRLESPLEEKKRLKTELAGIEEKRRFLQETLPSQNRRILALLTALSEMVPPDVVVNQIDQLDAGTFTLKGNAFRGKAITEFSDALSSIDSCGGVFLVSVSRAGEALNPRRRILPYDFTIHVSFGEDHDS